MLAAGACSGGDPGSGNSTQDARDASAAPAAAVDIPNACTFFAKAELESALGTELREGEPQSVSTESESQCRFRSELGSRATRTFPNSPLPASLGLTQ